MKDLRNLVGNDLDIKVEISVLEIKVIISCEMWEEIEYSVVCGSDGSIYVSLEDLGEYLEKQGVSMSELDYGINFDEMRAMYNIMNWMQQHSADLITMCDLCDKRGEENLPDDD